MTTCHCGLNTPYEGCCGRYLDGETPAPTPEALMRSRYTAYATNQIDYIANTMKGKPAIGFERQHVAEHNKDITWEQLTVIDAQADTVSFMATYTDTSGKKHCLAEISQFEQQGPQWFYIEGKMLKPPKNGPCPCKSGLKFKRCCGN